MTPIRRFRAAAAAVLVLLCAPSFGADATLSTDFNSAYIWRGQTTTKGLVFQPALDVSGLSIGKVPLTFNVWGNVNLDDWDGQVPKNQFSEIDLTVTAALPKGFSLSYVEYAYPTGDPSTREFFAGWSHEFSFATPSVTCYYDVGAADSGFLLLGLERELALGERAAVVLTGELGYAGEGFAIYYGGEKGGFNHYSLSGGLSFKLGEKGSVVGTIGYTDSLDHAVLPEQAVHTYGGVSLSYSF